MRGSLSTAAGASSMPTRDYGQVTARLRGRRRNGLAMSCALPASQRNVSTLRAFTKVLASQHFSLLSAVGLLPCHVLREGIRAGALSNTAERRSALSLLPS